MTVIRWLLGRLILLIDALTSPRGIKRADETQSLLDDQTRHFSLYQLKACPFCVKVRRFIKKHSLKIETREIKQNPQFRADLLEQGGKEKVPCLRIENSDGSTTWLYESNDIIRYLEEQILTLTISDDDTPCEARS